MSIFEGSELSEPLNEVKYRDYDHLFWLVFNVCLSGTYSVYMIGYFNSIAFDDTAAIFGITHNRAFMQGLLSFSVTIGACFGGYLTQYLTNRLSRRQCFLYVAYGSLVILVLLQSTNVGVLFCCRVVQGMSVGATAILRSIYIKEMVPLELAGRLGMVNQLSMAIGHIFAFSVTLVLSWVMTADYYWRVVYAFPAVFMVVHIYHLHFTYPFQTPKYLISNNRIKQARQLLNRIYKEQYVQQRLDELKRYIMLGRIANAESPKAISMKDLNSTVDQNPQPISNNKLAVWTAYLLAMMQHLTGIQIIILYTGQIMQNVWPHLSKTLPVLMQMLGLGASFVTFNTIHLYGRKTLVQWSIMAMVPLHLLVFGCFYWQSSGSNDSVALHFTIVCALVVLRCIFSLSLGPILWIYLPQIVEAEVIAKATMVNWFAGSMVTFLFPILVEWWGGPAWVFFMLAIMLVLGYIANIMMMVETKDKREWEVREEYDEKLREYTHGQSSARF